MAEEDQDSRTEAATAHRLAQAAAQGHVPLSREVSSATGLGAAALVLMMAGPQLARHLGNTVLPLLARAGELDPQIGLRLAVQALATTAGPLMLAVLLAGCAAALLQTGFALRPSAISVNLGRLNPLAGLRRLAGLDNLANVVKSLGKAVILGFGAWHVLSQEVPRLLATAGMPPALLLAHLLRVVLSLMMYLVAAQVVFAVIDVLWVRWRHATSLRMTREEIRQEHKDTDGDPQIKARIRKLRMARARRRMMAAVPKATVVVTNPTHFAVALTYDRGQKGAPRVVAKGVDEVAARIREIARSSGVPIIPNPLLARALYTVELDAEIPTEHFKAVAEIIAYVWRLQRTLRSGAA
jgi:flagellar biosynthesis protein FlhB